MCLFDWCACVRACVRARARARACVCVQADRYLAKLTHALAAEGKALPARPFGHKAQAHGSV